MSQPTIAIPKDIIEPIIQAQITAAVAQALGPHTFILRDAITGILATKVDSDGKPSTYGNSKPWIDWAVGDAIRKAALEAITQEVEKLNGAIKKQLVTELSRKNSPMVKQIAEGLANGVFGPDVVKWRLAINVEPRS